MAGLVERAWLLPVPGGGTRVWAGRQLRGLQSFRGLGAREVTKQQQREQSSSAAVPSRTHLGPFNLPALQNREARELGRIGPEAGGCWRCLLEPPCCRAGAGHRAMASSLGVRRKSICSLGEYRLGRVSPIAQRPGWFSSSLPIGASGAKAACASAVACLRFSGLGNHGMLLIERRAAGASAGTKGNARLVTARAAAASAAAAAGGDGDPARGKAPARLAQKQLFLEERTGEALSEEELNAPVPKITEAHVKVSFARSGGPGGQNVNKVSTKVDMRFNVYDADWLPERIRLKIIDQESNRVNGDGELVVSSTRTRTQKGNIEDALEKIQKIIDAAAYVPPPPSAEKKARINKLARAENERRLQTKKMKSDKKTDRRSKGSWD